MDHARTRSAGYVLLTDGVGKPFVPFLPRAGHNKGKHKRMQKKLLNRLHKDMENRGKRIILSCK